MFTRDHPIPGVATHPHYDPQRKSLGDVQLYARRMNLASIEPVSDPLVCPTTFCLANAGREYLAYQPDTEGDIVLKLPPAHYRVETFDTISSETEITYLDWPGGTRTFSKPPHVAEDWLLYVKTR